MHIQIPVKLVHDRAGYLEDLFVTRARSCNRIHVLFEECERDILA
jgi:hypothetical protein